MSKMKNEAHVTEQKNPAFLKNTISSIALSVALSAAMMATPAFAQDGDEEPEADIIIEDGDSDPIIVDDSGILAIAGPGLTAGSDGDNFITVSGEDFTLINDGTLTTINATYVISIGMSASGAAITNNGTISGDTSGVELAGGNAVLTNNGIIRGDEFDGIFTTGDGNIITNNGTISGGRGGIFIRSATGTVINNDGTVSADFGDGILDIGIGSNITNNGTISSGQNGVSLTGNDGILSNNGVISGGVRGILVFGDGNTITNTGTIEGNPDGVFTGDIDVGILDMGTGTNITNDGMIFGSATGVALEGDDGVLNNDGMISGDENGILVTGDGNTINNTGTIEGVLNGIFINGAAGTVIVNDGTISGMTNAGILDGGTGSNITNNDLIFGLEVGVALNGDDGVLINNGMIGGLISQAVFITGNNNILTNNGDIFTMGDGIEVTGDDNTINNTGSIDGFQGIIINGAADTVIVNDGTIMGQVFGGIVDTGTGTNITNNGMIFGDFRGVELNGDNGVLTNNGMIFADTFDGVTILGNGNTITNTGTIAGNFNGIALFDGADTVIVNDGTITAEIFNGIFVLDDGTNITNNGTISGGDSGVAVFGGSNTIINTGIIEGGGDGILLVGDGTNITNNGTISGGDSGVSVFGGSNTIINTGIIESGGIGISINAATTTDMTNFIVNDGTIIGGTREGILDRGIGLNLINNGTITVMGDSAFSSLTLFGRNFVAVNNGDILGGVGEDGAPRSISELGGVVLLQSTQLINGEPRGETSTFTNNGLIDAGQVAVITPADEDAGTEEITELVSNEGAGIFISNFFDATDLVVVNNGTIQGRGDAAASLGQAGDGIRVARGGVFAGSITNAAGALIASEGANGTVAGIRFINGVSFQGTVDNAGTITGVQNGVYFGTGDHTGGIFTNAATGLISSDSRAFNIDGTGLTLINQGMIVGTGNQRNGTVYADGTANGFTIDNAGTIDAGAGNNGVGVSIQAGAADGDVIDFTLTNTGSIIGRGMGIAAVDGDADTGEGAMPAVAAGAGLLIFGGAAGAEVTSDITNQGLISSEGTGAVVIDNVFYTGTFTNAGMLSGPAAFDASTALNAISFVQTGGGALNGDYIGSAFGDSFTFDTGTSSLGGDILGGVDVLVSGDTVIPGIVAPVNMAADMAATDPVTVPGAIVNIDGERMIEGNLTVNGTLNFDLTADTLMIDGDTIFGEDSVINIATTLVGQGNIGDSITIIDETGAFTDNGVTVNVIDDDFLLNYDVILGSVTVAVSAADVSNLSGDANVNALGGALTSAISANALPDDVFNALNGVATVGAFEAASVSLLPALSGGVTREIHETQNVSDDMITARLSTGGTYGLWGQFQGRAADADPTSLSSNGYDASAYGGTIGFDVQANEALTVGVALSYNIIDLDQIAGAGPAGQTEIDAFSATVYAGYQAEQLFVNGSVGYSFSDVDTARQTAVGTALGAFDVDGIRAQAVVGYDIGSENYKLAPFAGLRYAKLSTDQYSETGSGLDLAIDADSVDFLEGRIGAMFATTRTAALNFSLNGAYVYDFMADPAAFNLGIAGAPVFRVVGDEPAESRFEFGGGLGFDNGKGVSLSLNYRGEFASDYSSHGGVFTLRYAF